MKKVNLIIMLLIIVFAMPVICVRAQTAVDFRLPQAAGLDYVFALERGAGRDTVARGSFDAAGNAKIQAPPFVGLGGAGVAKLFLTGAQTPMVNMILNSEQGVVVSGEVNNLIFQNSPENEALQRFMQRQNELLQQYVAVFGNQESGSSDALLLNIKKRNIEQDYDKLSAEIATTPLYAGRVMQILRYLAFTGSSLTQTPEDVTAELHDFIVNKLDFNDLYVSGFWTMTFDAWYENSMTASDSVLVADARRMLERSGEVKNFEESKEFKDGENVDRVEIYRATSQAIINVLGKYSRREYLLPAIFTDIQYPVLGQPAPAVIINGTDSIFPKNALLMFYDSDCGNCQNELHNLIDKYPLLKDNNVRVISIAADVDKELFEYTAQKIVWTDNYSDFKGFDGVNFRNYGVVGTPTFVLIDPEGIVRGRYARVGEIIKE